MHNFHIKRLTIMVIVVLCVVALAGCGQAAAVQRPTPTAGAVQTSIVGECNISQEGDVFIVSGSIDVVNGAWIDVSVVAQDGKVLANRTFQKSDAPISESFTLTENQMDGVVDVKGYICCAPSYYHKQSDEAYDAYGKKFENIANGEDTAVFNNEGIILTFASEWLYGTIPSPTAGPSVEATPSAETSASA